MKTHKYCTYWYEVKMHADRRGDGYHVSTRVRIPVRCEASGEFASRCTYLDPSSASVITEDIDNDRLFDSPYVTRQTDLVWEKNNNKYKLCAGDICIGQVTRMETYATPSSEKSKSYHITAFFPMLDSTGIFPGPKSLKRAKQTLETMFNEFRLEI